MGKNGRLGGRVDLETEKKFKRKAQRMGLSQVGLMELIAERDFIFLDENAKKVVDFLVGGNLPADVNKKKNISRSSGNPKNRNSVNFEDRGCRNKRKIGGIRG